MMNGAIPLLENGELQCELKELTALEIYDRIDLAFCGLEDGVTAKDTKEVRATLSKMVVMMGVLAERCHRQEELEVVQQAVGPLPATMEGSIDHD